MDVECTAVTVPVDDDDALASADATTRDEEAQRIAALEAWLRSGGATFPQLHVSVPGGEGGGERGVYSQADVPGGTELLTIPRSLLMTVADARETAPIGPKLAAATSRRRVEGAAPRLRLSAEKHCFLAAALLWERARGAASRFHPYIATLPATFPGSPLFWAPKEREALLAGSHMLAQVLERRAQLLADYEAIVGVAPELADVGTPEDWEWARCAVASRNFAISVDEGGGVGGDGGHTDALVPLAGTSAAGARCCCRDRVAALCSTHVARPPHRRHAEPPRPAANVVGLQQGAPRLYHRHHEGLAARCGGAG